MRAAVCIAILFTSLASASHLAAQANNVGSVALKVGLLAPQSSFEEETGEGSWDNGLAIGVVGTAWPRWPLDRRLGIRGQIVRSSHDGKNTVSEFTPIAINDPTVWLATMELAARLPLGVGTPFISGGVGGKHYTWKQSVHEVTRSFVITGAAGFEFQPASLPVGIVAELRAYHSKFRAFGVNDHEWTNGPMGGEVGGVNNLDLMLTTGFSYSF
jgi:hypothetical protein